MSEPSMQDVAAVLAARDFLWRVSRVDQTPRISRALRVEARALMRRYPPEDRLKRLLERTLE
jgi:hypothetical protein